MIKLTRDQFEALEREVAAHLGEPPGTVLPFVVDAGGFYYVDADSGFSLDVALVDSLPEGATEATPEVDPEATREARAEVLQWQSRNPEQGP